MEEPDPLEPVESPGHKRIRRKRGSTKYIHKKLRAYTDTTKLATPSTLPQSPLLSTGFEDLPNEVICLIFQELRDIDYLMYRQLRLSKRFGHIIDTRFYIFVYDGEENGGESDIYKPPTSGSVANFKNKKEFFQRIQELSYRYKVKYDQMTIFLDFRSDNGELSNAKVCQEISVACLHFGISLSVLVNAGGTFKVSVTVQSAKTKGMVRTIELLKPGGDGYYNISRRVQQQENHYLYEFMPSMVVDTNTTQAAIDLFTLEKVYWKSSIEKLKDLIILVHANGTMLKKVLLLDMLKGLTMLDLRTKDVNKSTILKLEFLDMPNLTHFNSWGAITVKFSNNKLPKLIQLYIEDIDTFTDFRTRNGNTKHELVFKGNHMPNLKALAISTHRLQQFEMEKYADVPKLDKFRLELRELNCLCNMIHFIETLKSTKHLSLMAKEGPLNDELITTYLAQLFDSDTLESLSINLKGVAEKHWLSSLQHKKFSNLYTLRLYNINIQSELPSFSTPRLRNLIIMGVYDLPTNIIIGDYPNLEHIYTRKHQSNQGRYEYCVSSTASKGPPTAEQTTLLTPDIRISPNSSYTWSFNYYGGSKNPNFLRYDVKNFDARVVKLQYHQRVEYLEELIDDESWFIHRGKPTR